MLVIGLKILRVVRAVALGVILKRTEVQSIDLWGKIVVEMVFPVVLSR
jgi:hypothetical protein